MGDRETNRSASAWKLAREQHGVVTRGQLLALGFSAEAITHRVRRGRLHPVGRGIYLVGRPELSNDGRWMVAVLGCGPDALLSHRSAAELWRMVPRRPGLIDVAVPLGVSRRRPEVRLHRKSGEGPGLDGHGRRLVPRRIRGIPVTDPTATLIDFATCGSRGELEGAVNEVSHLDLLHPERLREELRARPGQPGVRILAALLDRDTFVLTQSELERLFLPLAREAGLPLPEGQTRLSRTRVDFYWPELRLVVECDSLRYHRTAAKQAEDVRRDQEHVRAGRRTLRVTHYQVRYEPDYVRALLRDLARQLIPAANGDL